jgi:hypothetical protein
MSRSCLPFALALALGVACGFGTLICTAGGAIDALVATETCGGGAARVGSSVGAALADGAGGSCVAVEIDGVLCAEGGRVASNATTDASPSGATAPIA